MTLPISGWQNKHGTSERNCVCGSWKNHWINVSGNSWPKTCIVSDCSNAPSVGAHVINSKVKGEKIAPMCKSCNNSDDSFSLKGGRTLVNANKSETCEK